MVYLIEQMERWIEMVVTLMGYPGIAFLMMLEHIIPPIPSEVIMPFAGFQVAQGRLAFALALLAGSLGSTLGALGMYAIGALVQRNRLEEWVRKYGKWMLLSESDLEKGLATFDRYGKPAIFFGHVIPGIRSFISLPAGVERMPLALFVTLTFLGTSMWNAILLGAGVMLHSRWREFLSFIEAYETIIWVLLAAGFVLFISHKLRRRASRQEL